MSGSSPAVSLSRTIVLAVPNPAGDILLPWPEKSPGTTQDYSIDVSAWADDAGETVSSFTAMVSVSGSTTLPLRAAAQTLQPGNVCTVILSGGASVTQCAVTFNISTPTRTLQITCTIVVSNISAMLDRYGNRAVISSAIDPATSAQITALEQTIAAETSRAEVEETSLSGSIAAIQGSIASIGESLTSLAGSSTMTGSELHDFEQTTNSAIQSGGGGGGGVAGTSVTGATVSVAGELQITLSTGQTITAGHVAGPPGASGRGIVATLQPSPGVLVIAYSDSTTSTLTLPASTVAGPPGAPGPVSVTGVPKGFWNASANAPTLSSNGGGGILGDAYVVGTAGNTLLDGISSWALGDVLYRGASTWARIPAAALAAAAATLSFQNGLISDDSLNSGALKVVDGAGNIVAIFDGSGLTLGRIASSIGSVSGLLSAGELTAPIIDTTGVTFSDDGSGSSGLKIVDPFGNILSTFGTAGFTSAVVPTSLTPTSLSVSDESGNALLGADSAAGTASLPGMALEVSTGTIGFGLIDPLGFVAGFVDTSGNGAGVLGGAGSSSSSGSTWSAADIAASNNRNLALSAGVTRAFSSVIARPVWNINHHVGFGQSLSTGYEGWPVLSTTQPYDNLMFGQSVRPYLGSGVSSGGTFTPFGDANFHPLVATAQNGTLLLNTSQQAALSPGDLTNGETHMEGSLNYFRRMQLQARGLLSDPTRLNLASACGVGSQTVEALSKGATPNLYNRLIQCVTGAKATATAGTLTYGVVAYDHLQGEQNYAGGTGVSQTASAFASLTLALYQNFCADLAAITGQAQQPAAFTYQTGENFVTDAGNMGVGMAQLNMALQNPEFWFLVAPDYPVTNKVSGHLDPNGYRWLGKQFGKVKHKVLTLGQGWLPLYPTALRIRGNTILIDFHVPEPPLALDLPYVVNTATNYSDGGFTVRDGGTTIPITGIAVVSDTQVMLTISSAPSGADIAAGNIAVSYADAEHGGNGCLRDSDPAVSDDLYAYTAGNGQYTSANIAALVGNPYPLQNWCVGFWLSVTQG